MQIIKHIKSVCIVGDIIAQLLNLKRADILDCFVFDNEP